MKKIELNSISLHRSYSSDYIEFYYLQFYLNGRFTEISLGNFKRI